MLGALERRDGYEVRPMIFPRTKFVDENDIHQQVRAIEAEYVEVLKEFARPPVNYERVAEEMVDLMQATETALRILQEKHGIPIASVQSFVEAKNHRRGYYK